MSATETKIPFRLVALGGLEGPVGLDKPDLGLFQRVGVGTQVPTFPFHVVGTGDTPASIEGSNASGAFLRVTSTAAASAGIEFRANGASQGPRLYQKNTTNEFRLTNHLGTDAIEILGSSSASVKILRKFFLPSPGASDVPVAQTTTPIFMNAGLPTNSFGADGQICFNGSATTLATFIMKRTSGTWAYLT